MKKTNDFSSEGFDLDNIPSNQNEGDVVLELNGNVTKEGGDIKKPAKIKTNSDIPDELIAAEEWKAKGNAAFKAKNYLGAYEYYSNAIESCPGEVSGDEAMKLKEEFDLKEREKLAERHRREQEKRLKIPEDHRRKSNESSSDANDSNDSNSKENESSLEPPATFVVPKHRHAKNLSIYHSNRAASLYHLTRYTECIRDCTISIIFNKAYVKPVLRRSAAYEATEQMEEALVDAKHASKLEPSNRKILKDVRRLEKLEAERMEKLKEETMGKLKDLGNSILGNFGLSLDNFKTEKDPNTGSYNISFSNS